MNDFGEATRLGAFIIPVYTLQNMEVLPKKLTKTKVDIVGNVNWGS